MKTVSQILDAIEASSRDIENWLNRLKLSTEYAETTPGKARLFSYDNVLELSLISSFARDRRMPLQTAADMAAEALRLIKSGKTPTAHIVRDGDVDGASFVYSMDKVVEAMHGAKKGVSFVRLDSIIEPVDELFSEGE